MENSSIIDSGQVSPTGLSVTQEAIQILNETRKWAKFLSILGFIMIGFIALLGLSMGSILSLIPNSNAMGIPSLAFTVLYFLFALLYFFPVLYLYKFSSNLKIALNQNDEESLTVAFSNLKSLFKFMGIMAIITLSLYALIFIGAIIGASIMR